MTEPPRAQVLPGSAGPWPADAELLATARGWHDEGHPVALATVVQTWGSSPRPAGSVLIIRGDGLFQGSVSGGCIEGEVVRVAREVLAGAPPQVLDFGVSNDLAWEVGLACGGRVQVFVEPLQ